MKVARWVLRRAALGNKCRLSDRSELRSLVIKLNRRDSILVEQPGVDAATNFQNKAVL